ncbi:MAG: hypothetical protein LBD46_05030 [Endomicrobium sp.]|nr:hypothetical protein [Endomicrobium sp.]
MNKTAWHVLITAAIAEIIMFCSLILRHMFNVENAAKGYLYIFVLIFFYLSILRIVKSYNTALTISLTAAGFLAFKFIYSIINPAAIASFLFCEISFFTYTFTTAKGLKHNQDKHFIILSLLLYVCAIYFSPYAIILPFFIYAYKKARKAEE